MISFERNSDRGGRSTLAGRIFTTDLINKNLSRCKKSLEKAVSVIFLSSVSRPDEKCYDHPKLKFICVYIDFLDRTEILVR